jgi:hypothetical protein
MDLGTLKHTGDRGNLILCAIFISLLGLKSIYRIILHGSVEDHEY